jgi:predicted nucleotidyltransferase
LLKALSDRPRIEQLERYVERLIQEQGETLEFIVLFGSMARGDWSPTSDFDLFVGLRGEDRKRFTDRVGEFQSLTEGDIDVLPYSRAEWLGLAEQRALILLEALAYGIPLWDRGGFSELQRSFQQWRESGQVAPYGSGWRIA